MADVLVRHCRVRIVRRGGWSWGPEPRVLLKSALERIPGLIGTELENLFAGDGETAREIASPLRITVPLPLAMLRAAASAEGAAPQLRTALSGRVAGALRQALERAGVEFAEPEREREASPAAARAAAEARPSETADPLEVLIDWAQRGQLQHRLSRLSVTALGAWLDWVERARPAAAPIDGARIAAVAPPLARLAARYPEAPADEAERLRRRLTVVAAVEGLHPGALSDAAVREAIARLAPCGRDPHAAAPVADAAMAARGDPLPASKTQAASEAATHPAETRARAASRAVARAESFDLRVESVLPFLLLGPLARIGYLDAVSALFQAADAPDDLPFFALSLAYKVLAPPARGWLRSPPSLASAAAFGLLAEAPPDAALAAMARRIGAFTPLLDSVIATAMVEGHRPGTPLLVTSAKPTQLLLSDLDGSFPITSGIAGDLVAVLKDLQRDVVLVAASAASPETLAAFHGAGLRFVTDAAPCRGETWRILRGRPDERWWTNDAQGNDGQLACAARKLGDAAQDAEAFWQAIGIARPSIPRDSGQDCDDAVAVAAGAALATIAWELWREREPTSPLLALERFGDLDGRVRADATRVRVSLPLGRRFRDLSEHGFLDDVRGVPWFGGRVLSFTSG